MKNKLFDAVQMVREIRDAMYRQSADPNFDVSEFDQIKEKWAKILDQQEKKKTSPTDLFDFTQAFAKAEPANELDKYENSLKAYRDLKGVINTAYDEGIYEGILKVDKAMKLKGLSITDITELTGLAEDKSYN